MQPVLRRLRCVVRENGTAGEAVTMTGMVYVVWTSGVGVGGGEKKKMKVKSFLFSILVSDRGLKGVQKGSFVFENRVTCRAVISCRARPVVEWGLYRVYGCDQPAPTGTVYA